MWAGEMRVLRSGRCMRFKNSVWRSKAWWPAAGGGTRGWSGGVRHHSWLCCIAAITMAHLFQEAHCMLQVSRSTSLQVTAGGVSASIVGQHWDCWAPQMSIAETSWAAAI